MCEPPTPPHLTPAFFRALFTKSTKSTESPSESDSTRRIRALVEQMDTPEGYAKVAARADPQLLGSRHTLAVSGYSRPC
jgi:hypothetical protein